MRTYWDWYQYKNDLSGGEDFLNLSAKGFSAKAKIAPIDVILIDFIGSILNLG